MASDDNRKFCGVCRRSLYMNENLLNGEMCTDCRSHYEGECGSGTADNVALWAANRAWLFASAQIEAAAPRPSPGPRPGDPGPSRWSGERSRARRRR